MSLAEGAPTSTDASRRDEFSHERFERETSWSGVFQRARARDGGVIEVIHRRRRMEDVKNAASRCSAAFNAVIEISPRGR